MVRLSVLLLIRSCLVLGIAGLSQTAAEAAIKVHGLFTNNTVRQRGVKLPVWGTTDKPDKVTVKLAGQELGRARRRPVARRVRSAHGRRIADDEYQPRGRETRFDQSHRRRRLGLRRTVEHGMAALPDCRRSEAVAAATNDKIRLFTVPRRAARLPRPTSAASGFPRIRKARPAFRRWAITLAAIWSRLCTCRSA